MCIIKKTGIKVLPTFLEKSGTGGRERERVKHQIPRSCDSMINQRFHGNPDNLNINLRPKINL